MSRPGKAQLNVETPDFSENLELCPHVHLLCYIEKTEPFQWF